MTKGEDFVPGKITYERAEGGEQAHLKINLADAASDDIRALNKILQWQDGKPNLPNVEFDLDPNAIAGAKLINALERRGFDVEFNKEEGTVDISKDIKLGDGKSPGEPIRRAQVIFDPEFGPVVEIGKGHFVHDHRLSVREKAWLIKNARDVT